MRIQTALSLCIIVALSGLISPARAQQSTEAFIPIGKSPGVSGVSSYVGTVETADDAGRTVTVRSDGRLQSVEITDQTRIWLDRSEYRAKNSSGTLQDLKKGLRIEVKPEDDEPDQADWIKIDPGSGG